MHTTTTTIVIMEIIIIMIVLIYPQHYTMLYCLEYRICSATILTVLFYCMHIMALSAILRTVSDYFPIKIITHSACSRTSSISAVLDTHALSRLVRGIGCY